MYHPLDELDLCVKAANKNFVIILPALPIEELDLRRRRLDLDGFLPLSDLDLVLAFLFFLFFFGASSDSGSSCGSSDGFSLASSFSSPEEPCLILSHFSSGVSLFSFSPFSSSTCATSFGSSFFLLSVLIFLHGGSSFSSSPFSVFCNSLRYQSSSSASSSIKTSSISGSSSLSSSPVRADLRASIRFCAVAASA